MSEDTLALSRLVVDTFGGRVLSSPSEIARDGRDVTEATGCDWRALGWSATGRGLLAMPGRFRRSGGRRRHPGSPHHGRQSPRRAECLAISDATADLTERDAHPIPNIPSSLLATSSRRSCGTWPAPRGRGRVPSARSARLGANCRCRSGMS
jgi:hypothetical protein